MSRSHARTLAALSSCALLVAACASDDRLESDEASTEPPAPAVRAMAWPAPATTAGAPLLVPPPFECKGVREDKTVPVEQYPVPKPPFGKGLFPCSRCHDRLDDFNPNPRPLLAMHIEIRLVHGSREQWCYDCHNPTGRDKLRLAGGRLVSFDTSYELCGQCHGEKLRDWRLGIHGRRIGCWNGERQYLLCVNCHDPHAPKFKPMHPRPRPKRPGEIHLDEGDES